MRLRSKIKSIGVDSTYQPSHMENKGKEKEVEKEEEKTQRLSFALKKAQHEMLEHLENSKDKEKCLDIIKPHLIYGLCKLLIKVAPEAQRKMAEIVFANECGHIVSNEEKGADMYTSDKMSAIEHKFSSVKAKDNYKCNINISIPKATNIIEKRALILESIRKKTNGPCGGMQIDIYSKATGEKLNEYFLSHLFLVSYFEYLKDEVFPKINSTIINWGCTKCKHCHVYHKLANMKKLDDILTSIWSDKESLNIFRTEHSGWKALIEGKNVPANCQG